MKFNFKIQQYQTDAVDAVVQAFNGQGFYSGIKYNRDLGKQDFTKIQQITFLGEDEVDPLDDTGYKNELVHLTDEQLLKNIHNIQTKNNIKLSSNLVKDLGVCSLDIEMETGTGKTYVYIKTMFELNKQYGWTKFVIVVPSIAIREGVYKSFLSMEEHFALEYGKRMQYFVYNSKQLSKIDAFASDAGMHVMIINTQAFNSSMNEEKSKVVSVFAIRNFKFLGFALGKGKNGIYIRAHTKSLKKAKAKLKELTSRSQGRNVRVVMQKVKVYIRGWLGYFGIASMKTTMQEWDGWLRRRFRCYIWKQWKKPRTRAKNLIKLGIPEWQAWAVSNCRKAYWHMARNGHVQRAISKERLAQAGYYSILDRYESVHLCD